MKPKSVRDMSGLVNRIIVCFERHMRRYGYKKTTVDGITAELHISKRTLYATFDSKEELLCEIAWRDTNALLNQFKANLALNLQHDNNLEAFFHIIYQDRMRRCKDVILSGIYN